MNARQYWTQQMDEAFAFMERMRRYPVSECREGMASLQEAARDRDVEFSATRINNEHPRVFFIREGLIESFRSLAADFNRREWTLRVEDGYRSPTMQRALSHSQAIFQTILNKVIWELEGEIPSPELMFRRLSALIATRCKVGTHVSGSAMDISLFDRKTGKEIPRGGPYLEMSERTPMTSPFITPEEQRNRDEIKTLCLQHGWVAYPYEFWHFSSGDAYAESLSESEKPARYGPLAFEDHKVRFLEGAESDAMLEPLAFYRAKIAGAVKKLKAEPALSSRS